MFEKITEVIFWILWCLLAVFVVATIVAVVWCIVTNSWF